MKKIKKVTDRFVSNFFLSVKCATCTINLGKSLIENGKRLQ
ncbi:hypothetical protein NE617_02130 [Lactococcus lactis]|nr:hypothetical protein [Lactococcus lactis]